MKFYRTSSSLEIRQQIKNSGIKYYLYGLYDIEGNIFYIGAGTKHRVCVHLGNSKHNRKKDLRSKYIQKQKSLGNKIQAEILAYSNKREEILRLEVHIIRQLGRIDLGTGVLTNHTDGGDGMTNLRPGAIKHTEESKAKISAGLKKNKRALSREEIDRLRSFSLGRKPTQQQIQSTADKNSISLTCLDNGLVFKNGLAVAGWFKETLNLTVPTSNISAAVKNGQRCRGYKFVKTKDLKNESFSTEEHFRDRRLYPITCNETGEVFLKVKDVLEFFKQNGHPEITYSMVEYRINKPKPIIGLTFSR